MKLTAPTNTTWFVCLALFVVALIASLITIPVLTDLSPWIALVGLGLSLAGAYFTKL